MPTFERKKLRPLFLVLAAVLCAFQLSTSAGLYTPNPMVIRSVHLGIILTLIFMWRPPLREYRVSPKPEPIWIFLWDIMFIAMSAASCGYIATHEPQLMGRMAQIDELDTTQLLLGAACIISILEATRRMAGNALLIVACAALAYAFWGDALPGNLGHYPLEFQRVVETIYLLGDGIWGASIGSSAGIIFVFILFGSLLNKTGMANVFLELACLLTRNAVGGPAKVAIFGSCLFGSVSGSAAGNVFATGTFTIPLMKRVGYKPEFAGAVEAVASSGGLIMPPVMGSIAFVMAEYTNTGYLAICKAALLPACLYYLCLFMMIHFQAQRQNIKGTPPDLVPDRKEMMRKLYHLAPLVLLIVTMMSGFSINYAALGACLSVVVLSCLGKDTRIGVRRLLDIIQDAASNILMIATCCACVGIVIAVVTMTGFGFSFVSIMSSIAQTSIWLFLLLLMVACILFGMGLPALPAYLLVATFGAPVLVNAGVPLIAAHLFVMYYAISSGITPPVCLVAYAGAAVADAPPMKTGLTSFRLGICGFLVPFFFIFEPSLLLMGEWHTVLLSTATAVFGVICLASSLQGRLCVESDKLERVCMFIAGVSLVYPGFMTDFLGLGLALFVLLRQRMRKSSPGMGVS